MKMFVAAATALLLGTAAGATVAASHKGRTKSPDDIICKELSMSGSRLDEKRVCMTRFQWEDQQREARQTIEKAQTQQINGGHP